MILTIIQQTEIGFEYKIYGKKPIRLLKKQVLFELDFDISMEKKKLQERLKHFAIQIVRFSENLPNQSGFRTIRNQIVRSGPSAAANYRAACRGKSTKDYINKMGTVEEELDETLFWLEFTVGLSEDFRSIITPLWKEGNELLSIIVASIITARRNGNK